MWGRLILSLLAVTSIFGEEFDEDFLSANKLFAASVYKEVLKDGEPNFLVSPIWAQSILALTQSGARGKTQEELRTGLKLSNDQNKIETAFKSLLGSEDLHLFHTANKLYLEENFTIKDEFKKVATEVFDADLENIKFAAMNNWVEKQTESKIQNLIDPEKMFDSTMAVLINALNFKGNWSIPFNENIFSLRFTQIDGSLIQVNFSSLFDLYKHAVNKELDAKFVELPFEGGDFSMVIVLPNKKDGIVELENQIDKVFLESNFIEDFVLVALPEFRTESKIDYKKILQNLGVREPFAPEANFSGISDQNLRIRDVIQKTYIDCNIEGVKTAAATHTHISEDGAEAAATTNVYSQFVDVAPQTIFEDDFYIDRPFIYYIKQKNLIIFAGRIAFLS